MGTANPIFSQNLRIKDRQIDHEESAPITQVSISPKTNLELAILDVQKKNKTKAKLDKKKV